MRENLKTLGFFVLIAGVCVVPFLHKKISHGRNLLQQESENGRELYTGKTRIVYNPLDSAYVVTDRLKEMVKTESELDFSRYSVWPVVSVWVDPDDLYSNERGIVTNPDKKGRLWERASYLSYYEKGVRKFSSYAGIRSHGGVNRLLYKNISLRFHFRKDIGEKSFLTNLKIGQTPGSPIKRLVLRRDTKFHFANDLSYSMIRQMGGLAPHIKHVAVYLNGEFYQFMQMTEQLHEDQTRYYYGHDQFIHYKLKSSNSMRDRLRYENAIHIVKAQPKPISFQKFDKEYDLDGFTTHMLSVIYLGMLDWPQGVWIRDLKNPDGKWKIVAWDYDNAFTRYIDFKGGRVNGPAWIINGFETAMTQHDASLKTKLFTRLLKESPEYRKFFVRKVEKMFSKDLTEDFFQEKFREYELLTHDAGNLPHMVLSVKTMKDFVKNKKSIFCRQLQKVIGEVPDTCTSLNYSESNMAGR